jgi:transmembrane protein TMEM260 (protein O-mannosyltransferase)
VTVQRVLSALALIFALAHVPFLATSLEDIDSVNFALGVRDFDVATHRPHPPGYPVYIALGKLATAIAGFGVDAPASVTEAKALAVLSLLAALVAIPFLYRIFAALGASPEFDIHAIAAVAVTVSCPLLWYLAVRPMSDLPGLAFALASQACLLLAWSRQRPGDDGDRRLSVDVLRSSGQMIVAGAFLAGLAIGVRSQTMWLTLPLLIVILFDRIGRGVAGALIGSTTMFVIGGLAWGIPLLMASGGLNAYLAALGTQAGEDFTAGEMLYTNPSPRAAAFALMRTFVDPWDSTTLAIVVLGLAAAGVVQLLWRDRRSLAPVMALSVPYAIFHLLFQDTSFVRYALPLVPVIAFLAVRGVGLVSVAAVAVAAAAISIAAVAIASPVLVAYAAEQSPTVRVLAAMKAEARNSSPAALAMHQTFVRPLEAEEVGFSLQLPSPPRLEWLELGKFWKTGSTGTVWFLADPVRSDLALIDPRSREDSIEVRWPLVARPAFGGMRPSAVRWYRMRPPGWFAEEGWSLTPEAAGISRLMSRGPHVSPIRAMVRRRNDAARLMVGGRNLAGPNHPAARFTIAIDGAVFQEFEAGPGFFLQTLDIPPGRLMGEGALATLTIHSAPASGAAPIPTAIEQFDLQSADDFMWAYDSGWQEAEYSPALGVWRWTTERSTLRVIGPPRALRVKLAVESPLRYFDDAPLVRAMAGSRELAATTISASREWSFDVPADALAGSSGLISIETNQTFVPAERSGAADQRRLGLRVFLVQVSNLLTPPEVSR